MNRYSKSTALVAGLVSATGFAPLGWWPVTLVAFAIWMWLTHTAPNQRAAMARGWLFGVGHFTVGMNWIAGAFRYQETMPVWLGWIAVVALAVYIAVYPAMAAGLAWRWGKPRGAPFVLIFAAAWIATEYLRATMFTGYAWNPLGVVMVPTSADGVAKLIGTYGLSGCVVLVAGALAHRRRIIAFPVALGALLVAGWVTILVAGDPGRSDRNITVVQPNIAQQDKQDESFDEKNWAKLARLTGVPTNRPRLILWPEAAVPYYLEDESWARDRIARLIGPRDVVLTGGDALIWDKQGRAVGARNSLFAIDANGAMLARYDKSHLVPYGEYLPMRPWLSAIGLSRLVPGDLDFTPGPGPQTITLPAMGKVGVQICYEIIFSGDVVNATDRPDFLFNPSNDAWFGAWGPPEHLAQAQLRAIEEGMPIVRSTPTGISAVIDSNGKLLVALPLGKAGVISMDMPRAAQLTPFARFGNVLPLIFALTLIGFAVALRLRYR